MNSYKNLRLNFFFKNWEIWQQGVSLALGQLLTGFETTRVYFTAVLTTPLVTPALRLCVSCRLVSCCFLLLSPAFLVDTIFWLLGLLYLWLFPYTHTLLDMLLFSF